MSEPQMVEMVQPLVDGEEVLGIGMFQPRGTSGAMGASGAAGLGTNDVAGMAIGALGMIGAEHAAAMVEHQPRWTMLAVTPTRVIAFEGLAKGIGWKPGRAHAVARTASAGGAGWDRTIDRGIMSPLL